VIAASIAVIVLGGIYAVVHFLIVNPRGES
jgi:hypothetical protein